MRLVKNMEGLMFHPWLDPLVDLAQRMRTTLVMHNKLKENKQEEKLARRLTERREELDGEQQTLLIDRSRHIEVLKALPGIRETEESERKKGDLEGPKQKKRDKLYALGEQMRIEQYVLQELQSELTILKDTPPSVADAEEELRKLQTFAYIKNVLVTTDFLEVITEPIVVSCHNQLYDLGNYRIKILFGDYKRFPLPVVRCVVSARKDGVLKHPDGAFEGRNLCFGYREIQLKELIKHWRYLEALDIAMLSLFCVSDVKLPEMFDQYRRLPSDTPQPTWTIAVDLDPLI